MKLVHVKWNNLFTGNYANISYRRLINHNVSVRILKHRRFLRDEPIIF